MTYRERRERKAERLHEWADKRQTDATAVFKANEVYRGDHAFNFQPGHIPERARVIARTDRAIESLNKANGMESRAGNIESQLDASIYDDDPDAVDRLRERIASLEAERERIKAYNASCRKGAPDESLLDDAQRANVASLRRIGWLEPDGQMRGGTANLSGNISKQRERLQRLESARVAKAAVADAAADGQPWVVRPTAWPGYVEVAFPAKPEREILDELRAAGFRWNRTRSAWHGRSDALPDRFSEAAS